MVTTLQLTYASMFNYTVLQVWKQKYFTKPIIKQQMFMSKNYRFKVLNTLITYNDDNGIGHIKNSKNYHVVLSRVNFRSRRCNMPISIDHDKKVKGSESLLHTFIHH